MKAKLPTKVKVGPRVFNIIYNPIIKCKDEEVYGYCDGPELEIKISSKGSLASIKTTIFHEYLHAVFYVTGQRDSINDDDKEEGIVVAFENFMSEVVNWKSDVWMDWKLIELKDKD